LLQKAEAGKLETLGMPGQVHEGELNKTQTPISPVFCSGGHLVPGTVNGVETSFLIDTGAGVSLLNEDQWKKADIGNAKLSLGQNSNWLVLMGLHSMYWEV